MFYFTKSIECFAKLRLLRVTANVFSCFSYNVVVQLFNYSCNFSSEASLMQMCILVSQIYLP